MVRFFRWYGGLAKSFFIYRKQNRERHFWEKEFWSGLAVEFFNFAKFYGATVILFIVASLLWGSLSEQTRGLVIGTVVSGWAYIVAFAKAFWSALDPIKPFFVWLGSLDWHGGAVKVERFILHVIVAMLTFAFAEIIIVSILNFVKRTLTGTLFKEKGLAIMSWVSLILAIFVGYYFTTSSYGVAIVNWITALTSIQKPV